MWFTCKKVIDNEIFFSIGPIFSSGIRVINRRNATNKYGKSALNMVGFFAFCFNVCVMK